MALQYNLETLKEKIIAKDWNTYGMRYSGSDLVALQAKFSVCFDNLQKLKNLNPNFEFENDLLDLIHTAASHARQGSKAADTTIEFTNNTIMALLAYHQTKNCTEEPVKIQIPTDVIVDSDQGSVIAQSITDQNELNNAFYNAENKEQLLQEKLNLFYKKALNGQSTKERQLTGPGKLNSQRMHTPFIRDLYFINFESLKEQMNKLCKKIVAAFSSENKEVGTELRGPICGKTAIEIEAPRTKTAEKVAHLLTLTGGFKVKQPPVVDPLITARATADFR